MKNRSDITIYNIAYNIILGWDWKFVNWIITSMTLKWQANVMLSAITRKRYLKEDTLAKKKKREIFTVHSS